MIKDLNLMRAIHIALSSLKCEHCNLSSSCQTPCPSPMMFQMGSSAPCRSICDNYYLLMSNVLGCDVSLWSKTRIQRILQFQFVKMFWCKSLKWLLSQGMASMTEVRWCNSLIAVQTDTLIFFTERPVSGLWLFCLSVDKGTGIQSLKWNLKFFFFLLEEDREVGKIYHKRQFLKKLPHLQGMMLKNLYRWGY